MLLNDVETSTTSVRGTRLISGYC